MSPNPVRLVDAVATFQRIALARAVHRKDPGCIRITRMHDHRKANVTDLARHVDADSLPAPCGAVEPIDAAVVLLIQSIWLARAQAHAVRIVEPGLAGIKTLHHVQPVDERLPAAAAVD